jgi:hypothetical protein
MPAASMHYTQKHSEYLLIHCTVALAFYLPLLLMLTATVTTSCVYELMLPINQLAVKDTEYGRQIKSKQRLILTQPVLSPNAKP